MKNKRKIISWVLLLGWMTFIFYMSNQTGNVSSGQSNKVVEILKMLGFNFNNTANNIITFIVRKTAHFSEYFILYLLSYNVIRHYRDCNRCIGAILVVIIYSASDELHQYFIPGRSMALRDVIIDTTGGLIAMFLQNIIFLFRKKTSKNIKNGTISNA